MKMSIFLKLLVYSCMCYNYFNYSDKLLDIVVYFFQNNIFVRDKHGCFIKKVEFVGLSNS